MWKAFLRLVNRWAVPAPTHAQELLAQIAHGRKTPRLFICPAIDSPMVTGVFRPRLLLPESDASDEDLLMIFRHEWTHFRRGDVVVKLLIVVAKAIHWMNPAVYLLSREMNLYCETSCDEAVLMGCDKMERRRYAETVMSVMTQTSMRQSALCTGFQGGLKRTKRRIIHMLDTRNKKSGVLSLVVVLMLSILSGAALAVEPETTESETALQLPLSNEIDCSLLTFEYSYPAILYSDTYGSIPVYPFYDDPTYPGALYSPNVPVSITGSVWRDERFRGVSEDNGMRYLQGIINLGERIEMVYIPEMFVKLVEEYSDCVLPTATIVADEGQQHTNLYEKMYTDVPSTILAEGSQVEIISRNEQWVQIRQGNVTGYVQAGNLTMDAETELAFQPAFLEGYTDAPGYAYRNNAYNDWFYSMCLQYGSHDYWDMEQMALMTEVQERYGQYDGTPLKSEDGTANINVLYWSFRGTESMITYSCAIPDVTMIDRYKAVQRAVRDFAELSAISEGSITFNGNGQFTLTEWAMRDICEDLGELDGDVPVWSLALMSETQYASYLISAYDGTVVYRSFTERED